MVKFVLYDISEDTLKTKICCGEWMVNEFLGLHSAQTFVIRIVHVKGISF